MHPLSVKRSLIVLGFLLVIFIIVGFFLPTGTNLANTAQTAAALPKTVNSVALPVVQIHGFAIPVEIATSAAAVRKGLSGRASLASDSGMLFAFSRPYIYRFWMPDMHFPLDMVWINDDAVVGLTENASNDFDPDHPVFYTPPQPAQYVLEVNAGFIARHHIRTGDRVTLPKIQ